MPFTLAAYSQSVALNGLAQINALADQSQTIVNNGIVVPPAYPYLAAGYYVAANANMAQFQAPSLRKLATSYIFPADTAANPTANPPFEYLGFYNPIEMTKGDQLLGFGDNVNNAQQNTLLVWLTSGPLVPVRGQMFTLWAKSSTTLSANTWTPGTITPQTTLEEGIYAVVGMHVHFNGALAARLIFPGNLATTRPGCIGATTSAKPMPLVFRYGRLGKWGEFDAALLPQVEFLGTAATTSENVFLDLVKGPTGLGTQAAIAQSATVYQPAGQVGGIVPLTPF